MTWKCTQSALHFYAMVWYIYFVCLHYVLAKPELLKIKYRLNSQEFLVFSCHFFNPLNTVVRIIWEYCNHFSSCSIWLSRQTNPEMLLMVLPFGRQQLVFSSLLQVMTVSCHIEVLCLLCSDGFASPWVFCSGVCHLFVSVIPLHPSVQK